MLRYLLVALSLSLAHLLAAQQSPNIIYILVDDLGYGDVNFGLEGLDRFNNPNVRTPNLAALAARGMVFTDHYAASPVCSPSRAGLLTGRTPTRANIGLYINDVKDNEKYFLHGRELTVAEVLKEQGYQTAIFGKWHLNGADWEDPAAWTGWTGSFPAQQGFDHGIVSKENPHFTRKLKVNTQKHPGDFFTVDGEPLGPVKGYTSDLVTRWALDWINEERDADKPFFAYLPYDAVHIRVAAADKYVGLYDTGNARQDAYYANITHVDAAIGELVAGLEEAGLMENTLLFFSSDNGPDVLNMWDATYFCYGTSYPLMGEKYQLYEGGIRVPGMAVWPGMIGPGVSDLPNATLDVLPTLAALAGAELPADLELDGTNILPHLMDGEEVDRPRPLYWQFDLPREYENYEGEGYQRRIVGPDRSREPMLPRAKLRDGDYTLYGWADEAYAKPTEFKLYDLATDPEERNDLSERMPELAARLRDSLLSRHASVEADRLRTERATADKAMGMLPLKVHESGRWLVKSNGEPFFWLGDTAWNLFSNLDSTEAKRYLSDRREKRFNVIQAQIMPWELDRGNAYGELPFVNNDLRRPREEYWETADYIVEEACDQGLYMAILPMWARSYIETRRGKPENKLFLQDSIDLPYDYGRFLGERYRDFPNIIWIMGGDEWGSQDTVYQRMARGIVDGLGAEGFDRVLMSYHPQGGTYRPPATSTREFYPHKEWMDFNMIQSGHTVGNRNFETIAKDYAFEPPKPTLDSEPCYEGHPIRHKFENGVFNEWHLRRRGYWSVLAGGSGFTYGGNGIWQMSKPGLDDDTKFNYYWYEAIDLPGAHQMQHLRDLIESRPYVDPMLVPDQGVVTGPDTTTDRHLQSARAQDYSYRLIYFTDGSTSEIDLTQPVEKTYRASWYSPRDGEYTGAIPATLPSGEVHRVDPPGEAGPGNDWVLVLEASAP